MDTNVEELYTIPELERINDGYAYSEKFRDKLFIFKDNFILFRDSSYETISKKILDKSMAIVLNNLLPSLQPNEEELRKTIADVVDNKLDLYFQNINRLIDNLSDKVGLKIDLEDLQNWRTQIEKGVNILFEQYATDQTPLEKLPIDEIINNKLREFEENIKAYIAFHMNSGNTSEIQPSINNDVDLLTIYNQLQPIIDMRLNNFETAIKSYISSELSSMYNNLYGNVKLLISESNNVVTISTNVSNSIQCETELNKPKISTVMMLKESGFSISEIKEAYKEGLI